MRKRIKRGEPYRATKRLHTFRDQLFTRKQPWEIIEAAVEFGVSVKTIRHWVQVLGGLFPGENGEPGVLVERNGRRSVIRVLPGSLGVSPQLVDHAAIVLAKRMLDFAVDTSIDGGLARIQDGLLQSVDEEGNFLAAEEQGLLRQLDRKFVNYRLGHPVYSRAILDPLVVALIKNHRLRIRYHLDFHDRVVEPLSLANYRDVLYLIVRKTGSDKAFNLLVDRIQSANDLGPGERFRYPAHWSPEKHRGIRFGILPGSPIEIKLRFQPHMADYLTKRRWNFPCSVLKDADGSWLLSMHTEDTEEVVGWICSFSDDVRVESPATLRKEVVRRHRKAVQQYR